MSYLGITKYLGKTLSLFTQTRPNKAGDHTIHYDGNTLYSYSQPICRIIDHYHKNWGSSTNMNRRRRVMLITTRRHTHTTRMQIRQLVEKSHFADSIIWCTNVEANDEFSHNANVQVFKDQAKNLYIKGLRARCNTRHLIRDQQLVIARIKAYCKYFKIAAPFVQRIANNKRVMVRLAIQRLAGSPAML